MTLIAALVLAAGIVLYVLLPVLTGEAAPLERLDDEPTEADARKRVTLRALRDVEYDYVTGKLDDDDYRALKREISAEALEALDALGRAADERHPPAIQGAGVGTGSAGESTAVSLLEDEIQELRMGLRSGGICTGCGARRVPGARFCGGCGAAFPIPPSGGDSTGSG